MLQNTVLRTSGIAGIGDPYIVCNEEHRFMVAEQMLRIDVKPTDAVVVILDAGWCDIGPWSAIWEIGKQDASGNVLKGDVLVHESRNCFIFAESRFVTTVGLDDHVVVETADAVLVARKDRVQDVKAIVKQMNSRKRKEAVSHRKIYRPGDHINRLTAMSAFR